MFDTLIVHGSFGSPYENWFPWLTGALQQRNRRVVVPHFPEREMQNLQSWTRVLDAYADVLDDSLTVYAHSLAPAFVVDYFSAKERPIQKAVLVAPFYDLINIDEFDQVNRTFFVDARRLERFKRLCQKTICIYSDNDPYVPRELSDSFAAAVNAEVRLIPGGKHLNKSAGFTEFPLLLDV
jgi:hypothetical protein